MVFAEILPEFGRSSSHARHWHLHLETSFNKLSKDAMLDMSTVKKCLTVPSKSELQFEELFYS
jgi:hypothetical protein